jgi:hypothetical protein
MVIESKKNPVFENVPGAHEGTPLLRAADLKMVVLSESSSASFDEEMIDTMIREAEGLE